MGWGRKNTGSTAMKRSMFIISVCVRENISSTNILLTDEKIWSRPAA